MKKLIILLLSVFLFSQANAANMSHVAAPVGMEMAAPNAATTAASTATTFAAWSFIPSSNKTVSSVRFYASAVAGTLDSDDIAAHIYSSSTSDGKPNASVASSATCTATPTGAAMVEITGLSYAVTAGTQYWVVIKNAAAAPATNNFTIQRHIGVFQSSASGQSNFGWSGATTTDGSTWTVNGSSVIGTVIYSDSTQSNIFFTASGSSTGIYGSGGTTRHEGIYFTTPANAKLKIRGVAFQVNKNGTPTGNLSATLRVGASTYTSKNAIPPGQITTGKAIFYFDEVEVAASTVARITLSNSAADSSSNCYRVSFYTLNDDTDTKALIPMGIQYTVSADNAGTWTETDERVVSSAIFLDPASMFGVIAGGSGGAYVF